jgi:hypothetical protein
VIGQPAEAARESRSIDPLDTISHPVLVELAADGAEYQLAADRHQHEVWLWDRLREECRELWYREESIPLGCTSRNALYLRDGT